MVEWFIPPLVVVNRWDRDHAIIDGRYLSSPHSQSGFGSAFQVQRSGRFTLSGVGRNRS